MMDVLQFVSLSGGKDNTVTVLMAAEPQGGGDIFASGSLRSVRVTHDRL